MQRRSPTPGLLRHPAPDDERRHRRLTAGLAVALLSAQACTAGLPLPVGAARGVSDDAAGLSVERTAIDRHSGETALANVVTDAVVSAGSRLSGRAIDFAAINSTALHGLPAGTALTAASVRQAMPYPDTIYLFELSGRQLRDLVADNARRLYLLREFACAGGQLDPAGDAERGFLHFSAGLRYAVRFEEPVPGSGRVEGLTLLGEPVERVLGRRYTVALPSYVAHGRAGWDGGTVGGGLPADMTGHDLRALAAASAEDTGLSIHALLLDEIAARDGLIGATTGASKDGRLRVSVPGREFAGCR